MDNLTELQQFAAVMYATLRKAGAHIKNQPVIYVLENGFGRFLRLSGRAELVDRIDKQVDDFVAMACMVDPQDIVDWLKAEGLAPERRRSDGR